MTHDHDLPREHDPLRDRADLDRSGEGGAGRHEGDGVVLREEELRVRTERVPYGRVTFRKRVVTEERTVVVTVRREELEILEDESADASVAGANQGRFDPEAGVPGDPMGYADEPALGGERLDSGTDHAAVDDLRRTPEGDFEIVLRAEEPVVTLKTVAVERVRVSRATVTDTERVSAQVDHEEAVLEQDVPRGRADQT
ncbi:DUF2382 domain-containing protein [Mobilicoccus massiliensis]|uniref:DUF2382 domain-containing protein n=1 Tax=Mobilicoccus massiliensis TaxID=1522310 RepID=UPI0005901BD1|nr:DUF2382 domain-containing protein [Mobilicoccus massiliensis]